MASGAIALVVAALTFGVSSAVLRPTDSPFAATPGSGFTISSAVYAAPACSGPTVQLYPGASRCMVLTVKNNLSVPITVQTIATTIPTPPPGCPASNFDLPTFNGNLTVGGGATASTTGLPMSLIDTGTNQDACKDVTVNFNFTGSARYTDSTTTALTASSTTPTSGQPVTLTATVTGANASSDPSPPSGTVTFNRCPNVRCQSPKMLGTGTIGSGGVATLTTSSLLPSDRYVQAVYPGSGTDYTGSTSPLLTLDVAPPKTAAATTSGSGNGASGSTNSSSIAFTGADIAGMAMGGLALVGVGSFLVLTARRRRRTSET